MGGWEAVAVEGAAGAVGLGAKVALIEKRRLTPIVEWSEVEKMANQL